MLRARDSGTLHGIDPDPADAHDDDGVAGCVSAGPHVAAEARSSPRSPERRLVQRHAVVELDHRRVGTTMYSANAPEQQQLADILASAWKR